MGLKLTLRSSEFRLILRIRACSHLSALLAERWYSTNPSNCIPTRDLPAKSIGQKLGVGRCGDTHMEKLHNICGHLLLHVQVRQGAKLFSTHNMLFSNPVALCPSHLEFPSSLKGTNGTFYG